MNIQHIITKFGLNRQRLHEKVEHRVNKLFDNYGNFARTLLNDELINIRGELKDSWNRRCHPNPYSVIPGKAGREKSMMRQLSLELYLHKYAIKYANRLNVSVNNKN